MESRCEMALEVDIREWIAALGPYIAVLINAGLFWIIGQNVRKIEIATNSMKDALVSSTAKASDAEGEKRGIAIGVAQSADKAERGGA